MGVVAILTIIMEEHYPLLKMLLWRNRRILLIWNRGKVAILNIPLRIIIKIK
jgi:hypothetical protein